MHTVNIGYQTLCVASSCKCPQGEVSSDQASAALQSWGVPTHALCHRPPALTPTATYPATRSSAGLHPPRKLCPTFWLPRACPLAWAARKMLTACQVSVTDSHLMKHDQLWHRQLSIPEVYSTHSCGRCVCQVLFSGVVSSHPNAVVGYMRHVMRFLAAAKSLRTVMLGKSILGAEAAS